jgi:hypothetical protein
MWIPSWLALELDVTTSSSAFAERRPAEFVLVDRRSGRMGIATSTIFFLFFNHEEDRSLQAPADSNPG